MLLNEVRSLGHAATTRKHLSKILLSRITPFDILPDRVKKSIPSPVVALYHLASDRMLPHIAHLFSYPTVHQFEKDIDRLATRFRAVELSDVVRHLEGNGNLPDNALLLTFDDGYQEIAEVVAPVLIRKGMPAVFFLISSCIDNETMFYRNLASLLVDALSGGRVTSTMRAAAERVLDIDAHRTSIAKSILSVDYPRSGILYELASLFEIDPSTYLSKERPYLTSEEVRSLIAKGFAIGSHSIDRPHLGSLPPSEQERQVRDSIVNLEQRFGMACRAFAFPFDERGIDKATLFKLTRFVSSGLRNLASVRRLRCTCESASKTPG